LNLPTAQLGAFRYRNFRLYWLSQVVSNVSAWMQLLATGWLVLELTNSPALLGLNAFVQAIPILAFALIGGTTADRYDRYKLIRLVTAIQVIPEAILAALVWTGNVRVEHIFIYSFVSTTMSSFSNPARNAWVPSIVPQSALLSAIALNSIVWQGAAVVGPAVAGLIVANWGVAGCFVINVVGQLLGLGALLLVRPDTAVAVNRRMSSGWRDLRDGAIYAWKSPQVRAILLLVACANFFARPYQQFLPVFARDVLQVGPQGLGIMLTAPAAGTIVFGTVLAMVGRVPLMKTFFGASTVLGLAILGFVLTTSFPLAVVLLFVVGGCATISITTMNTALQEIVEEQLRGRTMSLFMTATWGGWRVGALPIGVIAGAWSASLAVGLAAGALLIALVPAARSRALWAIDGIRQERVEAARQAEEERVPATAGARGS
jgi:MFS family permease